MRCSSALRQVDQLRQFLTGQLPLLLVDLAFVGLFLAVLLAVAPPLGLVTAGRDAGVRAALALACSAGRRCTSVPASKRPAPRRPPWARP